MSQPRGLCVPARRLHPMFGDSLSTELGKSGQLHETVETEKAEVASEWRGDGGSP